MFELIFSRDSKSKELNSCLFFIMCLAILKVIVSIICSKGKMGFIFHTSFLTFIINFTILMVMQPPRDKTSKEYMNKLITTSFLVSLFLILYGMGGFVFMLVSKIRATSIPEGVLYLLNLLSLVAWLTTSLTISEEQGIYF